MMTRRHFFGINSTGVGLAALTSLLGRNLAAGERMQIGLPGLPHFAPTAKRIIYLFMSGGPSAPNRSTGGRLKSIIF